GEDGRGHHRRDLAAHDLAHEVDHLVVEDLAVFDRALQGFLRSKGHGRGSRAGTGRVYRGAANLARTRPKAASAAARRQCVVTCHARSPDALRLSGLRGHSAPGEGNRAESEAAQCRGAVVAPGMAQVRPWMHAVARWSHGWRSRATCHAPRCAAPSGAGLAPTPGCSCNGPGYRDDVTASRS